MENRGREDDVTITTHDRPDHLGFAVTSKAMDIDIDYTFAEADGTTTAVGTFDARPKGFMKILLPLMIKRDMAKQHANFVKLCEEQAS